MSRDDLKAPLIASTLSLPLDPINLFVAQRSIVCQLVQRNCLNKQTEFSFFFLCYASKISYIPTPDSHSQIVNLFYAVEYVLQIIHKNE